MKTARIRPQGPLDITTSGEFRDRAWRLIEEGVRHLIVDFGDVSAIDSSGIAKMLAVRKRLADAGGKMTVENITRPEIRKMFETLLLHTLMEIRDSVKEAEESR